MSNRIICAFMLFFSLSLGISAQTTVTGKVTDEENIPLPGVSVIVKGTTKGTATDFDGNYSIEANKGDVLEFSYIGFTPQSKIIKGGGKTLEVNVLLKLKSEVLDDVVVIGYGTKKKVNLTGAVSSVKVDDITEGRPINNLATGLSGAVSGLYVGPLQGGPSAGTPNINIRGIGTLGLGTSPLIVIDGAIAEGLAAINPEDIESVSVLKDAASASIYGSRAANGVLLITTKNGVAGKTKLNISSNVSMASVSNIDGIAPVSNYAEYMKLMNEAYENTKQQGPFSTKKIKEWENAGHSNPLKYPNVDWRDEVFRKSINTDYSISASGGSDKMTFFTSFRYTNNSGVIENSGQRRAVFRVNLDSHLLPWFTLGTKVNASLRKIDQGADLLADVFKYGILTSPGMVLKSPDGRYGSPNNSDEENGSVAGNNAFIRLNKRDGDKRLYDATFRFYGIITPIKGLQIKGSYTYDGTIGKNWYKPIYLDRWDFYNDSYMSPIGSMQTSITKEMSEKKREYMDAVATYDTHFFDKLDFSFMFGATQERYEYEYDKASKKDLISPELTVPNAAKGEASFSGNKTLWAMQSMFTRLNLIWDNKYLLELNMRRDGSSRFRPDYRWGNFPSASLGWRIDQEAFMKSVKENWLDQLKLRISYGVLGNNKVNDYESIPVYTKAVYVLNDQLQTGFAVSELKNKFLTWEKTYVANIGVDFSLLSNRLTGNIDVFDKTSKDILINLPAPLVHGTAKIPAQNSAEVRNRGIELDLSWQDKIGGEVNYFVKGNFSYIKNKVLKYKGEVADILPGSRYLKEGISIRPFYGFEYDRIIQTAEDLALVERMLQQFPLNASGKSEAFPYGTPGLGDILYKDLNDDGKITNEDRRVFEEAGWAYPILCGLSFGADYKGIDMSVTLQGSFGLKSSFEANYSTTNLRHGTQINKHIADGRWTPGKTNASYPRFTNKFDNNTLPSNFWFSDRSFVKIRNIQIGYTLPKVVSEKLYISRFRIYSSLENYFTFTSWKGIDPEFPGLDYPSMKQALLGINISL